MKRTALILLFASLFSLTHAQVSDVIASDMAIAGTGTARTDTWTAFQNPASLIQPYRFQIAAQYENRFLSKQLHTAMLQAAYCNKYVNVGLAYSFFGYAQYNQMLTNLTLARSFGKFSIGLGANLISLYAGSDIGYKHTAVPQIGLTACITKNLTLGFSTFNPFIQPIHILDSKRDLPAIYTIATDLRFHNDMRWDMQFSYDVNSTFKISTAYEWQALDLLLLKIGAYYQQYVVACLGIGLNLSTKEKGEFRFDINAELHPTLGLNLFSRLSYNL